MKELSIELWFHVAENISDKSSLVALCRVNRRMNSAFLPMLYKKIVIFDHQKAFILCTTISNDSNKEGELVDWLAIDPNRDELLEIKGFVPVLQTALSKMPKLKHLVLNYPREILDPVFDCFTPPFQLEMFQCYRCLSPYVVEFLSTQSTITILGLDDGWDGYQRNFLRQLNPGGLPLLSEVAAPFRILDVLVPGRPVSRVLAREARKSNITNGWGVLLHSTVPVTMISYEVWFFMRSKWIGYAYGVAGSKLANSVKTLSILVRCITPFTQQMELGRLFFEVQLLRWLSGLERFELKCDPDDQQEQSRIREWLGEMALMDKWRQAIPWLKSAHVYGLEIA